jgi:hypothetical protein
MIKNDEDDKSIIEDNTILANLKKEDSKIESEKNK